MITFTINDKELQVEEGTTVLEAALEAGITIPNLCYHKELTPYGACRVCLVEVIKRGWPSLQPACLYKVFDGLIVNTDTERVQKSRKIIFELLLARAPQSDRIKQLAAEYGVTETRIKLKEDKEPAGKLISGTVHVKGHAYVCYESGVYEFVQGAGAGAIFHLEKVKVRTEDEAT